MTNLQMMDQLLEDLKGLTDRTKKLRRLARASMRARQLRASQQSVAPSPANGSLP